ncbi:MAG: hypothetical protein H6573_25850 [Lewinellaceae bacterium]|nr:hypothetical protein [Phaeodactylibacter sp.]MCB0612606.1 hypothetical protein [Phaeodactylibacter sp.]MCB9350900.1 hypothetical protein [Lewinellaceae bacterium]
MKHLIEIARIVTKRKVRKIEIFDDHSLRHKNSKFNEFYEALRANKFKSDRDAAQHLYGCSPTDPKYRQLKSRFRKRLLNTLFFLDVNMPSASNYDRAYYSCNKDWTLVNTLSWYGAPHTAAQLARQVLTTSLKFQFTDLIVNCSRILRAYSAETGDENSFEEYNNYISEYTHTLEAEIRSEEIYQRVIINYNLPVSKKPELADQVQAYCETLVNLSKQYSSPVIHYNMYLVWVHRYEMEQDFDAMLEVCEQGEKYIAQNPLFEQESKLITFQTKRMSAYLHMLNYRDGRINAEKSLNHFPEGTETWFTFMEYYFLLAMHTENYINAIAIFNRAAGHPKFKKLDSLIQEKWSIFEGYVNYIIESEGKTNKVLRLHPQKGFRATKLLNNPVLYPKEQRIFSVLLIILQILFLLERKSFSGLPERIERLKKYANRQLRKEECHRSIQFIRLLQQLNKANFQVEEMSNTEKYYASLKSQPFFYRGIVSGLEVIPYEILWKRILSYLK